MHWACVKGEGGVWGTEESGHRRARHKGNFWLLCRITIGDRSTEGDRPWDGLAEDNVSTRYEDTIREEQRQLEGPTMDRQVPFRSSQATLERVGYINK